MKELRDDDTSKVVPHLMSKNLSTSIIKVQRWFKLINVTENTLFLPHDTVGYTVGFLILLHPMPLKKLKFNDVVNTTFSQWLSCLSKTVSGWYFETDYYYLHVNLTY
jgi:hypothetical protein